MSSQQSDCGPKSLTDPSSVAPCPESPPINNTRLRRFLVLLSLKLLRRIRPHQGYVLMLSSRLCLKCGPLRSLAEASAMRFIGENTSIPVPKIYCAFTRRGWTYILMERIRGDYIGQGWVWRSAESQAKILGQLKLMVKEMRSLPTPMGMRVANVDGGKLFDVRLAGSSLWFGPFETIQDFHRHLRQNVTFHHNNPPEVNELIELQDGPWDPPVFTHGDLSSLNVLARGDEVVGIIDWETAGWFPSYWEYTTARYVNPQNEFWKEYIDEFLDPMPNEQAMEEVRQRYFGDLGVQR